MKRLNTITCVIALVGILRRTESAIPRVVRIRIRLHNQSTLCTDYSTPILALISNRGPAVSRLNPVQMRTEPVRTVHSSSSSGLGNVLNRTGSSVSGFTRKYKNQTEPDFGNTNVYYDKSFVPGHLKGEESDSGEITETILASPSRNPTVSTTPTPTTDVPIAPPSTPPAPVPKIPLAPPAPAK